MSFVIAAPETLVRAASDLANIGSTLGAANAAALGPTTELLAAGADEVSAAIASLFAAHGQAYQAVSAQMSAFHAQFVQTFTAGAGAYASAEAAAAAPLEGLLNIVNTPTQLLLGRPLIGNGANGAPGTGQAGGAGGLLYGNGGPAGPGARPGRRPRWSRGLFGNGGRVGPG
ncbi:PE-PGRS family protein PE_PGRS24 [Mycobacterium tuberculosis]|nr:PE-PGRS family protein PE_PGRS24 [Mycobacterium tuberculosis]